MPQDRRVRKSQAAIRHAFIDLLHKYDLEQITVQQISDLADVNRSTFYTHYIDKYDLLEKMEDEQVEIIRTFIEEGDVYKNQTFSAESIRTIMEFLIGNIEKNMEFYQLMFTIGKDSNLHEKLYELITGHLNHFKNENNKIDDIPFSYFMSYVSGAGLSFIRHWVEDPNRIAKDDLIQHFYDIVNNGPATIIRRGE
ncbi:TetR/AcrR family transcriptional regulator [Staphylococcus warneri]|uniref:TetR/AcrR family transcriptional regulator n=1 Tax=Staphylococcus warneri TaxID=1292 RepID=UPI0002AD990F|nr:TetR-like C-terminal domain-containing protein [Staphylococcus warneri]AGC89641.1 hypothetical protein A284_01560 [Staphylococcus warneri SG1]KEK50008.1 bacterial regulatory s, tetR family protein [Staphylococcus warneri Lyso 1 2011]KEK56597.1 bacterial regulatory s, tetR family protein [Staphylococcus warneri Lyso 2 2011]MCM3052199.1 TetR/AcrR family transcriptional regulator C-terminal domain-containing protein [Staphylococcus warneri]MDH8805478.1 TetR-like C-terminal domain-containing pr